VATIEYTAEEERAAEARRTALKHKLLDGKVAVITGASRGIGAAIARELGVYGSNVVLNYAHSAELAEQLAREIEEANHTGTAVAIQADVSQPDEVTRLIQATWERFGRLDILINNAGITHDHTVRKMTWSEWEDVINTNLSGVFYCVHEALPYLLQSNGGTVVNIGSAVGLSGNIGQANYVAAKAGLIGLTKSLALEWARYHITVNCVAPGATETDMFADVPPEAREQYLQQIPLRRFGTPEEIASMVRFLCTEGTYITGQVISVNGGLYI
jgi:NAD(P)-dependent dehydrogenase (short-subunit alcohol dehydrogenase family)